MGNVTGRRTARAEKIASYADIPGWFGGIDHRIFRAILEGQADGPPGDLVELGAFMGRSAVVIGEYLRPDEQFVVVDLFGSDPSTLPRDGRPDGVAQLAKSWHGLSRRRFESHYLALHDRLPVVVQGLTSEVVRHVAPGQARFVHVDASHLYDDVREDVRSSSLMLRSDGVVVFDDFRNARWPGVAAAVWEAVLNDGLVPFAVTRKKLYGVFGDPSDALQVMRSMQSRDGQVVAHETEAMGHLILQMSLSAGSRPADPPAAGGRQRTARLRAEAGKVGRAVRPVATRLARATQDAAARRRP